MEAAVCVVPRIPQAGADDLPRVKQSTRNCCKDRGAQSRLSVVRSSIVDARMAFVIEVLGRRVATLVVGRISNIVDAVDDEFVPVVVLLISGFIARSCVLPVLFRSRLTRKCEYNLI